MVKPGYKQTEIGLLPEDWKLVPLIALSDGGMQNGAFYEVSRKGTGIFFLNVGNLYGDAPVQSASLQKFNASRSEIDRFRVNSGDLFFTRSSIVPTGIAYCNWYFGPNSEITIFDSHVVRFKTDLSKVVPMYLYLQCIAPSSRKYFISNAKTATMTTIDQSVLGECQIALCTMREQEKIADAITDVNALVMNLEKLIAKKKAIKQGAMQELLTGKRRLPGFSGDWTECILTDVADLITDIIPVSDIDPRYYIGTDNMVSNRGGVKQNRIGLQYSAVRHYTINDILLSNIRPYLKKIWYADTNGGCSNDVLVIRTKNDGKILAGFLYQLLSQDAFFDEVTANAVGTKMPRGDKNVIKAYPLCMPVDLQEQREILKIMSEMQVEIENLEKNLNKYKQIKQGMMSDLLTGRIRLIDKEDA